MGGTNDGRTDECCGASVGTKEREVRNSVWEYRLLSDRLQIVPRRKVRWKAKVDDCELLSEGL
jgi:hypothetical protein